MISAIGTLLKSLLLLTLTCSVVFSDFKVSDKGLIGKLAYLQSKTKHDRSESIKKGHQGTKFKDYLKEKLLESKKAKEPNKHKKNTEKSTIITSNINENLSIKNRNDTGKDTFRNAYSMNKSLYSDKVSHFSDLHEHKKRTNTNVILPVKRQKMNLSEAEMCQRIIRKYENKYNIPRNTLHAIALVESGTSCKGKKATIRYPWPWTVHTSTIVAGVHFETKSQAKNFIMHNISNGISNIDVGCMQLNMKYHSKAFCSVESALDPEKNVSRAAQCLYNRYKSCGSWSKAVSLYHCSDSVKGHKYFLKVMDAKREIMRNHT